MRSAISLAAAIALGLVFGLAGSAGSVSAGTGVQPEARFVAVVALEEAGQVAILKGPPWRVVRRANVAAGPHNVIASPDGELVAVTNWRARAVTLIRARSAL